MSEDTIIVATAVAADVTAEAIVGGRHTGSLGAIPPLEDVQKLKS